LLIFLNSQLRGIVFLVAQQHNTRIRTRKQPSGRPNTLSVIPTKAEITGLLLLVIPAKAGIQFLFVTLLVLRKA
jgi:hypothetical protein